MKLENQKIDSLDLSFEVAAPGISLVKIEDGVDLFTNEKTAKKSLKIQFIIEGVIEGPESNELVKLTHFCPIQTTWGEKQVLGILSLTDLLDPIAKKFKGEVDVMDEVFLNTLKLKLPGKILMAHHEVRKDQKGKDRANVIRFERASGAKPRPKKSAPAPENETTDDENW